MSSLLKLGHFLFSLDIKEDNDACDVIDDALFALPAFERGSYQALCRALRILLQVEWVHYICNFLVLQEFPNTV